MSSIKYIWKAGKIVATIIGTMVVKGRVASASMDTWGRSRRSSPAHSR